MSRIEIRGVDLPKDVPTFVKTWWRIYKGDPHWVPPLIAERKQFFNPQKNPYFKVATVRCFMALDDGTPVGTIAATVDHELQKDHPGLGLFGFFEFVNEERVGRSLFESAAHWLREQGMKSVLGPFNFNSNHEFGLLIDGFDRDPCIGNLHNRDYYPDMYESLGLTKIIDWYAYWFDGSDPIPPRIRNINDRFLKRHPGVELRSMDIRRYDEWVKIFWEIYNDAWPENWGHIYLTQEEFRFTAGNFKSFLQPDLCWFAYVDGEPAGASITVPDFNQVAKRMNGRILPFGWWHFWWGRRKIDQLRVFVMGVKKAYQHLPLGPTLYLKTWEDGLRLGVRGVEASLILENNHRMRGALGKQGARIYKTYRTFGISLEKVESR